MKGTEIITEARLNFGEKEALSIEDADLEQWVNTALGELYALLPMPELMTLSQTTSVPLNGGRGEIPEGLDHLLNVDVGDVSALEVSLNTVSTIQTNPFLEPYGPVYATDTHSIWIEGADGATSAELVHIDPPARITDFEQDVVLPKWHAALVLFTTAFAYAQEEDKGQAQHYRNEALALINRTTTAPLDEMPQEAPPA